MHTSLSDLNKNTPTVRWWIESKIKEDITRLPLLNEVELYPKFNYLATICEDLGINFWDMVQSVSGYHGMRILMHAILIVKGFPNGVRQMGEERDKKPSIPSDSIPGVL